MPENNFQPKSEQELRRMREVKERETRSRVPFRKAERTDRKDWGLGKRDRKEQKPDVPIAGAPDEGLEVTPIREERPAELIEKVVTINRVTKVTKGGKKLSFSALVVVGDGKGRVGYYLGKAGEVANAIKKGLNAAKKNMVTVPLNGSTIPHLIIGEFGGGEGDVKARFRWNRGHCRWSREGHL